MSVEFEVSNHVARIVINRPQSLNAVDSAAHKRLDEIWREIEARDDIRCAVLTGSGDRAFCAGADMKENDGLSGVNYWASPMRTKGVCLRDDISVPLIARVNGLALGSGFEMVMGCDIVIASQSAKFGLPEAKVGRVPLDGGMVMLPRLLPRNIAVGMMMTGRMIPAEELAGYGLVNSVVEPAKLDEETDRWVEEILACAPLSVKAIKASVRNTAQMSIHKAFAYGSNALISALSSQDADEGVQAFREKRAPVWQGR